MTNDICMWILCSVLWKAVAIYRARDLGSHWMYWFLQNLGIWPPAYRQNITPINRLRLPHIEGQGTILSKFLGKWAVERRDRCIIAMAITTLYLRCEWRSTVGYYHNKGLYLSAILANLPKLQSKTITFSARISSSFVATLTLINNRHLDLLLVTRAQR